MTQNVWFVTLCVLEVNSGSIVENNNFILRDQKERLHGLLDTEDEGKTILSNFGKYPPSDIASLSRKPAIITWVWRFLQHT